jgi:hypothetical protein
MSNACLSLSLIRNNEEYAKPFGPKEINAYEHPMIVSMGDRE